MTKAQGYKSQHYNPVVYLRQFRAPKTKAELWEYDLSTGTVNKSTPTACGCEDFYHSIALGNGECDHTTIEKAFGPLESRLPELFKAIRNTKPLCDELRQLFFTFTAIQYARSPGNVSKVHDFLSKIHQAAFEILCTRSTDFKKKLTDQEIDPDHAHAKFEMGASQGSALLFLLQAVEDVARIFADMRWSFLCAPADRFFYTSDRPVCCWLPVAKQSIFGAAITDRDVEITFPLSRKVCAFGCWTSPYPQPYHSASQEIVDSFNQTTVMKGWRFVYGPANDLKILSAVQEIAGIRSRRLPVEERDAPSK